MFGLFDSGPEYCPHCLENNCWLRLVEFNLEAEGLVYKCAECGEDQIKDSVPQRLLVSILWVFAYRVAADQLRDAVKAALDQFLGRADTKDEPEVHDV